MACIIIAIILIIILVALILWYFLKKPTTTTKPPTQSVSFAPIWKPRMMPQKSMEMRSSGAPVPFMNQAVIANEPSIVETENRLLEMARQPRVHRAENYQSNLRVLGDPFRGDLVIKPRECGINVPYQAEVSDLMQGYFQNRQC